MYGQSRKFFVIKYGGMAYRGRGRGLTQELTSSGLTAVFGLKMSGDGIRNSKVNPSVSSFCLRPGPAFQGFRLCRNIGLEAP